MNNERQNLAVVDQDTGPHVDEELGVIVLVHFPSAQEAQEARLGVRCSRIHGRSHLTGVAHDWIA